MGEYQIEPVLSLTALLPSPCSYGKPSEKMKPFNSPSTIFNGTFVQAIVPLEDEDEERAIEA
jgi:hypothetical protein